MPDVIHLPLMTEDGAFLGKAIEFRLDTETGYLTAIEIGGGVVDNLRKGKSILPIDDIVVIGNDVILVKKDAADSIAPVVTEKCDRASKEKKTSRLTERFRSNKNKEDSDWKELITRRRKNDSYEVEDSVMFQPIFTPEEEETLAEELAAAEEEEQAIEAEENAEEAAEVASETGESVRDEEVAQDYRNGGPAKTGIRYK